MRPVYQKAFLDVIQSAQVRIRELQRLRVVVDSVHAATAIVPLRSYVADARRDLVANPLFASVPYPAKLESYLHVQVRTPACKDPRLGLMGICQGVICSLPGVVPACASAHGFVRLLRTAAQRGQNGAQSAS